nr:MAG TPA: terminase small subunit [Caudoviricetes sp.]
MVTVAKGKYEKWLKKENLLLLEGWARDGLTDEQIAKNMGISVKTLYRWQEQYSQICQSLKKGKEVVDYEVENALLSSALEGNTTAQIFWLKNRRPDKWRDKQKEETDKTALDKLDSILKEIKKDAERSTDDAVHE